MADVQTDPLTGQIDLDLINTGAGSATRRIRGDLKREVSVLGPHSQTSSSFFLDWLLSDRT